MDAATALERLADIGVAVTLNERGNLLLSPEPPGGFLAELIAAVRENKPAIVAALSNRRVPASTGLAALLERLRSGQAWLVEHYDAYMDGEYPETTFVSGLVLWPSLEKLLRRLYGHQGCVNETGACLAAAPVVFGVRREPGGPRMTLLEHRRRMLVRAWIRYCENPQWAFWLLARAAKLAEADPRTIWRHLSVQANGADGANVGKQERGHI